MRATDWLKALPPQLSLARELAFLDAVRQGHAVNWPFGTMRVQAGQHVVEYRVASDYLAIGEQDDYVRITPAGDTAWACARALNCVLPTAKMVDQITEAASVRLKPRPCTTWEKLPKDKSGNVLKSWVGEPTFDGYGGLPGTRAQISTDWMVQHHMVNEAQLQRLLGAQSSGWLTAGHRKDVVLSNRLLEKPNRRVCIVGWPELNGRNIQPESTFHELSYADYSHGARLVEEEWKVDNEPTSYLAVLTDPVLGQYFGGPFARDALLYSTRRLEPKARPPGALQDDVLERGEKGHEVAAWQRLLNQKTRAGLREDGDFGPKTEAATKAAQRRCEIQDTGKADTETRARVAALADPAPITLPPDTEPQTRIEPYAGELNIKFVQAYWYTPGRKGGRVELLVVHDMEAPEKPGAAEGCAQYFRLGCPDALGNKRNASAHICVDVDSVVQCVRDSDTAHAAPGANHNGLHFEVPGFARQTADEWRDPYSAATLGILARLLAMKSREHGVPLTFVDAEGLLRGDRGVTTHAEISKACRLANERRLTSSSFYNSKDPSRPKSTHTDPGFHFPLAELLEAARLGA